MLCEKARVSWKLQREKNTKFFHKVINIIRKINIIVSFKVGENLINGLNDGLLQKLKEDDKCSMVMPFTKVEIELAIMKMESNKVPGPDGINVGVIKALWKCVKGNVWDFLSNFYDSGELPSGLCSSFIALISKTEAPTTSLDFRPISLMNVTLKILTKVLAPKLGKV
ncbi:hypothetical protein AgCh_028358 [Apium graveolens]